ncbi:M28 family peptidase [Limibacter armeniacum]|uniref:M28 family peptidase n=1 Tax=Limibacter armeniacum TaxID=466084 RepID=UPI002FE66202
MTAILSLLFAFIIFLLFLSLTIVWLTRPVFFIDKDSVSISSEEEKLKEHVHFLCNTPAPRNYQHPTSMQLVVQYIQDKFSEYGYQIIKQQYEADGMYYSNVIAFYGNEGSEERVVIGAHYDVFGDYPGADDNASGIAGLLEIARLLQKYQPKLPYAIELVAYANEERPFFKTDKMGSAIHAQSLLQEDTSIKVMVCLEMIGYFSDEINSQGYPLPFMDLLYPNRGNYISLVGSFGNHMTIGQFKSRMKEASSLPVYSINAPTGIKGLDSSDHRNYWDVGYNAIMVTNTSYYRNPNYHTADDTPDTLDYERMKHTVDGVYWAVINL